MAFDQHANFGYSTVATAPSPASSGTSLVLASGEGARFPTPGNGFNLVVWPAGVLPLLSNGEVVRCTARSTDTLTITRAQESSSARAIQVGDQVALVETAKNWTDMEAAFLLLAGRSGGQVAYGSSLASETLTIAGTSHGTKGKTYIEASSTFAVDGANARVGIGNSSPSYTFDVTGSVRLANTSGTVGLGAAPGTNVGLNIACPASDNTSAFGLYTGGQTITLGANSASAFGFYGGGQTIAVGAFTGLVTYSGYIAAQTKSGAGTIAAAYGLYVAAPTIGTANYGLISMGALNGIGTATPTVALHIVGGNQIITTTTDFATPLSLYTVSDSATGGPILYMYFQKTTAAVGDSIGSIGYYGKDSAHNDQFYGDMNVYILDPTSASEDSRYVFRVMEAGATTTPLSIANGVIVGAPTGSYKGAGTLNASAVYDDNVLLTCPALQPEFIKEGIVDLTKWDGLAPDVVTPTVLKTPVRDEKGQITSWAETTGATKREPRQHGAAHLFADMLAEGFDPRDPTNYFARLSADGALPGMPTLANWEHNALSSGEVLSRLWLACEFIALVAKSHEERMVALEARK